MNSIYFTRVFCPSWLSSRPTSPLARTGAGSSRRRIGQALGIAALLVAPWVLALPSDRQQTIDLQGNTAEVDQLKGTRVLRGNAIATQGTLVLTADVLTVYENERGETVRVVAEGQPAHYQQQVRPNEPLTHAYGNTIEYLVSEERIEIRENARLEQEQNQITAAVIHYDMKNGSYRAVGADGQSNEQNGGRVIIRVQPEALQRADDSPVEGNQTEGSE